MWVGDKIFYLSDRDRTMNLFAYDTVNGSTEKVTDFSEYDCKFSSCSADWIVFENGGWIYRYDVRGGGEPQKVEITLEADDIWGRSEYRGSVGRLSDFSLSPDGSRVLATGRGDIFSLPAEEGPVYNLTRSPGSHEREACWSPDGKHIAWFSDADGEYQLYVAPCGDIAAAKALTSFKSGYPSGLQWSPDGGKLYFLTDAREVYEADLARGRAERILVSELDGFYSFTLSPDGAWAAYTTLLPNKKSAIWLFDVAARKSYQLTDRWFDAWSPMFSRDGKYLFLSADTDFSYSYSSLEWNAAFRMSDKLFVLPLAAGTPNPMALKSDEYRPSEPDEAKDGKAKEADAEQNAVTRATSKA